MPTLAPARFDLIGTNAIQQGVDWTWPLRVEANALPAPPFVQSTPYVLGNYLVPQSGAETGFTYLVVTAGTSAAANPTWPTVKGGRVTSNTAVFMAIGSTRMIDTSTGSARMSVENSAGVDQVFASEGNGRFIVNFDPVKWAIGTVKALGNQVMSTTLNGWIYEAVVAGTTHASTEPVWPTTLGAVITDNTVTWRCVSTDAGASNLRIELPGSYTTSLTNWGLGNYDVEYYDAFNITTRLLEGVAELSQEVTEEGP